jgi:hypothetical protein
VIPPASVGSIYRDSDPPGVRRLEVPGGWLYRVESGVDTKGEGVTEEIAGHYWHAPVFVPRVG